MILLKQHLFLKKFPVTTLLRAIGFDSDKDILEIFGLSEEIPAKKKDLQKAVGRKLAARVLRKWTEDFVDEDTGEVVTVERNEIILERDVVLEESHFDLILDTGIETVILQKEDITEDYSIIYNTLQKDTASSEIEAVEYIYRQLRGAEPPDEETARSIIRNKPHIIMFYDIINLLLCIVDYGFFQLWNN